MSIQLNAVQARILGSLIEKSLTTPDLYPLSMNALVNACNQKTSRDPVMELSSSEVASELPWLIQNTLVGQRNEPGSRVNKFYHRAETLLNGGTTQEVSAIGVLLLRGPQTSGEIKIRTDRMCDFTGPDEVEKILADLAERNDGGIVTKLARQPGQKEARYMHLFSGAPVERAETAPPRSAPAVTAPRPSPLEERLKLLEQRLSLVEEQLRRSIPLP